MRKGTGSSLALLIAAAIWGFAFVAQRVGMKYIGPFTFTGIRFALGAISLIPLMIFYNNKDEKVKIKNIKGNNNLLGGVIIGIVLFFAASFQQVGLIGTSAGKAAFITGLYIVFVPILGLFLRHHIKANTWIGALIAVVGLYFLCVTNRFSISYSDMLELASAFLFAIHILLIDYFSQKINVLKLAFFQFITCSILSMITAVFIEHITASGILQALIPILYGGICSVGIAYTLQIVGQKNAEPSHAAIICSMETVFATIGGILILNEQLGVKGSIGCLLMLTGMILSQLKSNRQEDVEIESAC
ncbi:DMT family transporter [Clostridium pasteurianum]|uniref:DMT(Drug/metabolite transporter) superfamily permease n=1 Tax=Clostridium pasteurianum BC1 TaxID=86416 RepID=R4JY64_CLOPA|nr:DMT family transporter [Clostridium pasteurianum]AGK95228.1 DMT(drug/metabolite transporter) superfamily permease [Clostridium pasteurianum BC1]